MTSDNWKSLLIKILLMILTPLAMQLHLDAGPTALSAIATDLADLIVLAYGVYRTYRTKTVPHDAKVIGALLFAALLSCWPLDPASAQVKLTGNPKADFSNIAPFPGAPDKGTSVDNAFAKFNTDLQKITKEIVDKAIADVGAALDDANKHSDQISAPCWQSNLDLLRGLPTQWETPPATIGVALGIQIQRDLLNSITGTDAKSLKVACAALWGDQLKIVANVAGLLGIRIATGGLF